VSSESYSSSSANNGNLLLPIRVEAVKETPVWCFASRTDSSNIRTMYAGTGPFGIVLSSTDLRNWSTFMTVDDAHVMSSAVWANALFVGTGPHGKIFVHNFTSGEEYLFVETEDDVVTALVEFNGILYAGTSPTGIVYSFDGTLWNEEHRPYGKGVSAMAVSNEGLMVFSHGAESPVIYTGEVWKDYPSSSQSGQFQTISSTRVATRGIYGNTGTTKLVPENIVAVDAGTSAEDMVAVRPTSPQFDVLAAASLNNVVIFGGRSNGVVWQANGGVMSKLLDIGVPVNALLAVSEKTVMAASGNTLFHCESST